MTTMLAFMGFVPQTTGEWIDLVFLVAAVVSIWCVFGESLGLRGRGGDP